MTHPGHIQNSVKSAKESKPSRLVDKTIVYYSVLRTVKYTKVIKIRRAWSLWVRVLRFNPIARNLAEVARGEISAAETRGMRGYMEIHGPMLSRILGQPI